MITDATADDRGRTSNVSIDAIGIAFEPVFLWNKGQRGRTEPTGRDAKCYVDTRIKLASFRKAVFSHTIAAAHA